MNNKPLPNNDLSLQDRISKILIFVSIYTLLVVLFTSTVKYTLPFVLAGVFAILLRKPTKYLCTKLGIKSWLASLISTIVFFTLFIVIMVVTITALTGELISVTKSLQEFISNNSSSYFTQLEFFFEKLINSLNVIDPSVWDSIAATANNSINKFLQVGINGVTSLITFLFSFFTYIPYIGMTIAFTLLSTYFFTERLVNKSNNSKGLLDISINKNISNAIHHGKKLIGNYIFAYMFIIFVSTFITFIGFIILGVDYALLLSILSGLLDLLPIVGMACVYIPLALYFLIKGNVFVAIGLIILYLLVFLSRQFIEPKIMSSSLGISPIATLAAIFIGLQLNGFSGMIFCMMLIIIYKVLRTVEIL
ncbi:sporulation integral membrane protein YtvI [Clostridium sp.]|uniref:sporulation integral membrane protein YtvI n=1 Tax=Clostridium sp. TaxID=1506 RepID=UPI003F3D3F60